MNPNERSSHPSQAQIEARLQYLERNPSLAKGFSKASSARDVARKHWVRLAVQLNSMGGSAETWKHWNKDTSLHMVLFDDGNSGSINICSSSSQGYRNRFEGLGNILLMPEKCFGNRPFQALEQILTFI